MTLDRPIDPARVRALVGQIVDRVLAGEDAGATDVESVVASAPSQASAPPSSGGVDRTIAIGADHGGFPLKERLGFRLKEQGWTVLDCGTDSSESTDYPVYAHSVAKAVSDGSAAWGIVVDGAGIGSSMVANKVPGVRAALCYDLSTARNSREHNHANVLTLGAGLIGDGLAWQIVQAWLDTPWGDGRHARRAAMITDVEQMYLKAAR